jgi:propanol-preferring alcohol dehydrogenase
MSDVHYMMHDWAAPKMSLFGTKCAGHEVSVPDQIGVSMQNAYGLKGAGVVVKVGSKVKGWKVGDRGMSNPPNASLRQPLT